MKVLNKKVDGIPKGAVYIGRGSPWGNPFKIGKDGSRDDVVAAFAEYAVQRLEEEPDWLEPLRGKDLVCFCAPQLCHGDVISELLQINISEDKFGDTNDSP